ncbi:hypothetical protein L0F63_001160 [Massospora cicadina]|nr:hypothetical protein L0F63_001160 [Massospora cicadina]
MAWAMTTRFMGGVLNGNVGVVKSMISEMTDKTNRTKAFSFISMMLGLGFIVGPVLGGFLTHPAENFPQLFGNVQFLKDYPYFLPCGVTSFLCGIGSIFAYICLEETLTRSPPIPSVVTPLLNPRTQPPPKFFDISKGTWLVIVVFMGLSLMVAMSEELFTVWAKMVDSDLHQKTLAPLARIYVVNQPMLAWALLIVLHAFKTLCTVIGFTTANILLPETCQNKAHLGHINGVSLALCSLMRGVGPYICGVIYSKSLTSHLCFPLDYHFAFFVVAMVSGLSWSFSNKIKPEMYG